MCKIGPTGLNPIWLSGSNRLIRAGTDQIGKSPTKTGVSLCLCLSLPKAGSCIHTQRTPIIGERRKKKKEKKERKSINLVCAVLDRFAASV